MCPHDPQALALSSGSQPSGQRGRLAQVAELFDEPQPHGLADIFDVGPAQLIARADRPHHRRVPFDDIVPGVLIAVGSPSHESDHGWVVTHDRLRQALKTYALRTS